MTTPENNEHEEPQPGDDTAARKKFAARKKLYDALPDFWQGYVGVVDSSAETSRMAALMEQYRDLPMDLGDASIIATAEALRLRRVFTFDRQFYVYRLGDGGALEVLP